MTDKLNKASFRDLETQAESLGLGWKTDIEPDKGFIYFSTWSWDAGTDIGRDLVNRYTYTWTSGKLRVDVGSKTEVLRDTSYTVDVDPVMKKLGLIESKLIEMSTLSRTKEDDTSAIIKQFDPELMQIVEPAYIAGGEVDGHADAYKDPVEGPKQLVKAIEDGIEAKALQYSIGHIHKTKTFEIVKAWVNVEEKTLTDGTVIPANQPLVITKFHNEKAYNDRVEGRLTGLSMGALGSHEMVKGLREQLGTSTKPKRLIGDFILTHKAAHFAYTVPSQGGAASLKNEPYEIMKSSQNPVRDEVDSLIAEYEEEFTELDKSKILNSDVETKAPSTSIEAPDAGVDNKTLDKGQDMSEELLAKLAQAEKRAQTSEMKEDLVKYNLDKGLLGALASALVELDEVNKESVIKTLDAVIATKDSEIEVVKAANVELTKAAEAAPKEEATPLEKSMSTPEGHEDNSDPVEMTPSEILKANLALVKAQKS